LTTGGAPPVRLDFIAAGKILVAVLRFNLPAASEAQLSEAVQVWVLRTKIDTRVSQMEKPHPWRCGCVASDCRFNRAI
jgi:hypothetical protein